MGSGNQGAGSEVSSLLMSISTKFLLLPTGKFMQNNFPENVCFCFGGQGNVYLNHISPVGCACVHDALHIVILRRFYLHVVH